MYYGCWDSVSCRRRRRRLTPERPDDLPCTVYGTRARYSICTVNCAMRARACAPRTPSLTERTAASGRRGVAPGAPLVQARRPLAWRASAKTGRRVRRATTDSRGGAGQAPAVAAARLTREDARRARRPAGAARASHASRSDAPTRESHTKRRRDTRNARARGLVARPGGLRADESRRARRSYKVWREPRAGAHYCVL